MNILASTMGRSLDIFSNVLELIKRDLSIEQVGVYVSDSFFFEHSASGKKFLKDPSVSLLKEWEMTSAGSKKSPNWEKITGYEEEIGDPTLWNSLLADRRIFFGKYCKYKQDYRCKFTHQQLGGILEQALTEIDNLFSKVRPNLVLGFGTSTIGDYLFFLFACARGIPYLQLKATKIANLVSLNDSAVELSSHIKKYFLSPRELSSADLDAACKYIESVKADGVTYEGAILSGRERMMRRLRQSPMQIARNIIPSMKMFFNQTVRLDNHLPGRFIPVVYINFLQPIKAYFTEKRLVNETRYVRREQLSSLGEFLFYPLHFEPEVSLQVFGRSYQNQIELIRNLALSVPVGMKVLVKEHPRSLGFRPYGYYKKLLEIPNVYLLDPFVKAVNVVREARIIAVVSGSIGFEAAIVGKPVITFGPVVYNILPDSMIRHVTNISDLGNEIRSILTKYRYDKDALERYVGSTIAGAVPANVYTVLLNKRGRHTAKDSGGEESAGLSAEYKQLSGTLFEELAM